MNQKISCRKCGQTISRRSGLNWELTGFLMIIAAMGLVISGDFKIAGWSAAIGFIVFITGRFK